MGVSEWVAALIPTGIGTAVIWVIYHLHRDAVDAHDKRATEWQAAATVEKARGDEYQKQLVHILSKVKETTTTAGAP